MALPRESHSRKIRSKNKSVYENAVTGIQWSCMLLLIGSCVGLMGPYGKNVNLKGRTELLNTNPIKVCLPEKRIDLFTVVCLVAWPLNESEARVDLVLIETYLLFLC